MRVPRGQLLEALLACQRAANDGRPGEIDSIVDEVIQEEDRTELTDLERLARMAMNGQNDAALRFMEAKAKQNRL